MKRLATALALCIASFAPASLAQTGYPLYGSFQSGSVDTVNLQNLNTVISIPILGGPGRGGTNFSFSLANNSLVWTPSGGAWQPTSYGSWVTNPTFGSVSHSTTDTNGNCGKCIDGDCQGTTSINKFNNYVYTDPAGTQHGFLVNVTSTYSTCTDSTTYTGVWSGYSGDGLYYINLGPTNADPSQLVVTSTQTGTEMNLTNVPYAVTITDRNGNQITETSNDGTATWVDTAGHTILRQIPNGSNTEYHYYAPDGGSDEKFVLKYQNYSVMTNFGCSGLLEYNSSGNLAQWSLPYELDLPNGLKYTFTYEGTPGHSGYYTGRIYQVTVPAGGTYTYTYGTTNDGVSCSTGTIVNLTREISNGTSTATWQYTNAPSGSNFVTTVTAPQMPYDSAANQSVYTFNSSGQQITEQDYQGSVSSGTLLQTVNGTWATNGSPSTAVTVLPNNQQSEVATTYDNYGHLDQEVDYDWGAGGVGSKIRTTNLTYTTINAPVSFLALLSKQVLNGAGTVVFLKEFAYDGSTPTCISGAVQHDDTDFGCSYYTRGNRTSITTYASPAGPTGGLTKTLTYNTLGDVLTVSLNGTQLKQNNFSATTNYAYPDSVVTGSLTETYTYDPDTGQIATAKDSNNATTSYAYDTSKRLTTVTRPDNVELTTTYGDTAPPTLTQKNPVDSSGDALQMVTDYDELGRHSTTMTENASGTVESETETAYDPAGRVYQTSSPFTGSPSYWNTTQYDALSRTTSVANAGGGTASFSYTGNDVYQTLSPAPSGENTKRRQSQYNAAGMLTSVCEITSMSGSGTCSQTSSATGYWTEYSYDALGDLTGVSQNAQSGTQIQTRTYAYDGLRRMITEANPEAGNNTVYYFYDTDPGTKGGANCSGSYPGDLVKKVDVAGNVSCHTYDVLNRVLSTTYPYGPNSSNTPSKYFVYDSATVDSVAMANAEGRMAEAYTCTSSCSSKATDEGFSYTVLGQVSNSYESTPNSNGYYHVSQSYWSNGLPDQISGLTGLPTMTYTPDSIGRINTVSASAGTNPVTGTTYNVASEATQVSLGSGDNDAFQYDPAMFRMTQYQFNINGQSDTGALTWNANGSLGKLAITDAFNSSDTQTCTYTHDDLARIASTNCGSAFSGTYTYDAFGNLNKSGTYSFQPTYSSSTNQMSAIGSFTPTYDSNGDVTNDNLNTYAWDVEGRPTTIDGIGITYDALKRMVEQNNSGSYSQIVWSPTGTKIGYMSGQTFEQGNIPLPAGMVVAYNSSGILVYQHMDWLGSYRLASLPNRTVDSDLAYGPFGETYAQSGNRVDYAFTGQQEDTVSSAYDFLYREYGMQGRWPSPDPAGIATAHPSNPQSWDRYAYVLNNPLASIDATGLGRYGCLRQVRPRQLPQCIDTPFGVDGGEGGDGPGYGCEIDCGDNSGDYSYVPPGNNDDSDSNPGSDDDCSDSDSCTTDDSGGCADPEGCDLDPNRNANNNASPVCDDPTDSSCTDTLGSGPNDPNSNVAGGQNCGPAGAACNGQCNPGDASCNQPAPQMQPTLGQEVGRNAFLGAALTGGVGCVIGALGGVAGGSILGFGGSTVGGLGGCLALGVPGAMGGATLGALGTLLYRAIW